MRNLLIGILLAGAAITPAVAQDSGDGRRHHDQQQGDRGSGHQQRQQVQPQGQQEVRGPRGNGGNYYRPPQMPQAVPQQQVQVQQGQNGGWQRGRFESRGNVAPQNYVQQQQQQGSGYRGQDYRDRRGGWTGGNTYRQGEVVQQQNRNGWYGQRGTVQQQYREGNRYAQGWNRDWRNDNRYDWRRYRDSHRSTFHVGLYIDPFGYGYQPFGIGYRLPPVYFGQSYWIDPAMYDLPYPPPGTEWVRYWNDALLVDTYTGQIVDVIQGFFW